MGDSLTDHSDDQLMELVRQGRTEHFRALFLRHFPSLVRFLTSLSGNPEEARDIAQDVFIKVFEKRESYQPQNRFGSWIFTMGRHLLIDRVRSRKNHPLAHSSFLENTPSGDQPEEETGRCDPPVFSRTEHPLLACLDANLREVVLLRTVDGLSYAEISRLTGTTEAALRQMVCRALQRIRAQGGEAYEV